MLVFEFGDQTRGAFTQEQCHADTRDPQTLDADDRTDDEIHRQRWDRLQHHVHVHGAKTAIRRANPQVLSAKNFSAAALTTIAAEILATLPDAVDPLALSLNENPFAPPPAVRAALIESIDAANRYPEFLPEQLRTLIAGRIAVRDEQVILGAGATGVVMQVLHAVTAPGDRIVLTSPTFDGYPIFAQMARLTSVTVPLDEHGHHDLDAMADAARNAKVVVLCRPHNPTGTLESATDVERFLQRVPPDTVVLLDEAYIEFVAPEHRLDAPALVRRFPNVVVLRTFSGSWRRHGRSKVPRGARTVRCQLH